MTRFGKNLQLWREARNLLATLKGFIYYLAKIGTFFAKFYLLLLQMAKH